MKKKKEPNKNIKKIIFKKRMRNFYAEIEETGFLIFLLSLDILETENQESSLNEILILFHFFRV